MEVDDIKDKAKDLTGHITDYVETFYKLSVVKATDKATSIGSSLITGLALAIFGFFILIFGGIALGFWLGDLLQSRALGFAIIAGFFLLLLVIVVALRKQIVFPYFRDRLIRKFYV